MSTDTVIKSIDLCIDEQDKDVVLTFSNKTTRTYDSITAPKEDVMRILKMLLSEIAKEKLKPIREELQALKEDYNTPGRYDYMDDRISYLEQRIELLEEDLY